MNFHSHIYRRDLLMKLVTTVAGTLFGLIAPWILLTTPVAAADNQDTLQGKLVITGSSTVAPLALEIAKMFEKSHPGVRIDVQTGGSSRGVADATQGLADIGLVSRALKPEEKLVAHTVALDGIAMIVHQQNKVAQLSPEQIVGIYTGKISNWKDVGGQDAKITVVNKADGRSTLELFLHHFKLKPTDVKAHIIIGDNEQGIKTVAGNPQAIGYVSIGTAEFSAENGVKIKLLPLGGISSSVENVRNGTYPLARPLNLVTAKVPVGLAKAYIDFAQSQQAVPAVKEQFFVPVAKK
jgi:phosphate transport system substrate-binding protein